MSLLFPLSVFPLTCLFLKNACYLSSMEVVSVAALIWKIYRVVKNFCVDDPELWEFFHQL